MLVRHDVRAFMLVQRLRKTETADNRYGYTSWWLTLDRTAFRVQQVLKRLGVVLETPVTSCMSPDFLLRYLSVRPRPEDESTFVLNALPLSVELAGVGLIPSELRDAAKAVMDSSKDAPPYVQRRRLRELVNKAKAERGELLAQVIEDE
jgi:hypothetical protein